MLFAVLVLSAALSAEAPAAPPPADWNLAPVFADARAAAAEAAAIDAALPQFNAWRGHVAEPQTLVQALDLRSALRARATRLLVYANMRQARDAGDAAAAADAGAAQALLARLGAATAYIEPELVALPAGRQAQLAADPRLARHQLTLRQVAARAAHVLPADQEALVAGVAPLQMAPAAIRDTFTNAELPWPTVTVAGAPRRLNIQALRETLQDPDRATRRRAWEAVSATRAGFQQTEAALLSAYLAGQGWEARLRHWPSQAAFITAADPMPAGAFEALSAQARLAAQGPLARYYALKARKLGLPALTSYDLAAPFAPDTRRYTIDEARQMILAAVAPLGDEYHDRLARGLAQPLMDWRPAPAKAPGASTFYVAADIPGYVEASFGGAFDDVSAIAHEWGHWMHWDYSRLSGRPYETLFPPVSVGDAPSFLHELLLSDRAIATATNRDARIAALTNEIEILRIHYYDVVSQAAFDLALRDASDRGDPLDADHVSALYCDSAKRFAPAGLASDPRDCLGWVTEPYVFYDLYFYRYLLATSAAAFFAERVEAADQPAIARYRAFLAAGGSADATGLLKTAGFDPSDRAAYAAMTRRLDRLVTQLEKEVAAAQTGT